MQKFNKNSDMLNDHELLEALLYMMLPRIDTNPIAHRLLRLFGSLEAVFTAPLTELCTVEGIGESVASKIQLIGKTYERIYKSRNKKMKISSVSDLAEFVCAEFYNLKKERCEIFLLNARYKVLHSLPYSGDEFDRVNAEPKEVLTAIGVHKPKYLLIAHNHPSGSLLPSVADDYTTANLIKLCELLGVEVVDHVIVADGDYYSYSASGHLEEVKRNPSFFKMRATGKPY